MNTDKFSEAWRLVCRGDDVDELDVLMKAFSARDWCEISYEARSFFSEALNDDVESDSPLDFLISACIAKSWEAAFDAVAGCLGVDADDFELLCAEYFETEDKNEWPKPIGLQNIKRAMKKQRTKLEKAQKTARKVMREVTAGQK